MEVVVTYGDVTLYTSDLELLEPPAWFSDKLLFFYYEWLSRTSVRNPAVLFVVPEMIQLLSWTQDVADIKEMFEGLRLSERGLVLMPINDNSNPEAAGGSHWSLLAYTADDGVFRHYDSANHANLRNARRTTRIMSQVICNVTKECVPAGSPSQRNSYDCGVYVLAMSEYLATRYLEWLEAGKHGAPLGDIDEVASGISPDSISGLRRKIRATIESLRAARARGEEIE